MYKDVKINSIAKLFCLLMYSIVIIFLDSTFPFIILFCYYLFKISKKTSFSYIFISLFILLGLAMKVTDNLSIVLKLSMFIAFFHLYINDIIVSLKEEKKEVKEEKKVIDEVSIDKESINKENKELLEKELEKGTVIDKDTKDKIVENIETKSDFDYKEKLSLKLERFYNKRKEEVIKINNNFDYYSTMYVAIRLVLLVIVIMVD